jgi:hypothetical protein
MSVANPGKNAGGSGTACVVVPAAGSYTPNVVDKFAGSEVPPALALAAVNRYWPFLSKFVAFVRISIPKIGSSLVVVKVIA